MYTVIIQPAAVERLKGIRKTYQVMIRDTVVRHLVKEPTRTSRSRIKKLRGKQNATFRLRAGEYRIFYDVVGNEVRIVQVLHKSETAAFFKGGKA